METSVMSTTHKQAVLLGECVTAMSRAEENFDKGGAYVYIAAGLNRVAAQKAKLLGSDLIRDSAGVKSYWQFMNIKQSDLGNAHFLFGRHIPVYKSYEQAALVAEENGWGDMKLSAAKKAVSSLIGDVRLMQPNTSWQQGMLIFGSTATAIVNLSEAGRIVKRFELGHEESNRIKDATEGYKMKIGEEITALIRQDYSEVHGKTT